MSQKFLILSPRAWALPWHALPGRLCLGTQTSRVAEPRPPGVPRRSLGTRKLLSEVAGLLLDFLRGHPHGGFGLR